jgi:hypothetical protein
MHYTCATILHVEPSDRQSSSSLPTSFRFPRWVVELLDDLQRRLAHTRPLKKPPSRVEVMALALESYAEELGLESGNPEKRPPESTQPPRPQPPRDYALGDVVWSSERRKDLGRRRYLVDSIKTQPGGRNPKLRGWKVDANGQPFGGVVKMPAGRYEKAPLGKIEGVEEPFEGPRYYVKPAVRGGWMVYERLDAKDEIARGRVYEDRETAERAVPFVARGDHYPKPADLGTDEGETPQ